MQGVARFPGGFGVLGILLCLGLCLLCGSVYAGAQKEEYLSDSVRTALSATVADAAPPKPKFSSPEAKIAYLNWQAEVSAVLSRNRWMSGDLERRELLDTVYYEATRAALDPMLVLGLIQVESGFRKFAISSAGARGLMQVMPFWTRQIGDGHPTRLFNLQANLRYGCIILRHYLSLENGNLFYALGRYNGSRGKAAYPNAVMAATRRWQSLVRSPAQPTLQANAEPTQPGIAPR